ncbi:potassium channel family protein [Sphingosinicella terrae]|uniref:potassium channel family protein n=1 Tax=Sphingosinicella terrae TaxID=2172047 RepID=UPI000E0D4DED|nr:potassium channel family protein [Sphingosinicella terrae]
MSLRPTGPELLTLRRKSRTSPWVSFAWRIALVVVMLVFVVAVHWFERDGLRDNLDGHITFSDVIYFTAVSITTTGYGDIVPISPHTRTFDALVVTPIRIFFILIFLGTAYQFVLRRTWDRWIMARIQKKLTDHVVIAGFGTSGSEAVVELIARGTKSDCIVVVDPDPAAIASAESLGCAVLQGDATRDKTLEAVRVAQSKVLIISAGRDDTSILICLTARHLAPDLKISIAVRAEDNELPARQAGATTVINPVSFAGLLLAGSAHGPNIADYIADLASTQGRVRLAEREARPEEYGKPLAQITTGLGLRVYRSGQPIGFWERDCEQLRAGDRIVEIVPSVSREAAFKVPPGHANYTTPTLK